MHKNDIYKMWSRTQTCMLYSVLMMYPTTTVWIIEILTKWSVQACKQMHHHLSSLSDLWSCPERWAGGGHCHPKSIFSFEVLTPLHILDMSLKKGRRPRNNRHVFRVGGFFTPSKSSPPTSKKTHQKERKDRAREEKTFPIEKDPFLKPGCHHNSPWKDG